MTNILEESWNERLRAVLFESIGIIGEDGVVDRSQEFMLSVDSSNIKHFIVTEIATARRETLRELREKVRKLTIEPIPELEGSDIDADMVAANETVQAVFNIITHLEAELIV